MLLEEKWAAFKSGSDVRGVGVRSGQESPLYLSDEIVERITCGFVEWLRKYRNDDSEITVAVGRDTRISSLRIKDNVIGALIKMGVKVYDCDYSSTPAMFMTTINLDCTGSIEVTASHHPYDKNGLKFFTRLGGLDGEDIKEILYFAQENQFIYAEKFGTVTEFDHMKVYAEGLRKMICDGINATDYSRPLRGFRIVVDAGNGIGGFYATKVLAPLGADIRGSRYLDYNGMFPNHVPNPEDSKAMQSICEAVVQNDAHLGVIFDTDVDRAACVDAGGVEINGNRLVALASAIAVENNFGATIVTDSVTSDGLTDFIEHKLCARHLSYKRGYRNVIDKQIELNHSAVNCPLAIETSGHAAFRENYYLDDGAYLVTKIIIKMVLLAKEGKRISDLLSGLKEAREKLSLRFTIEKSDFKLYGEELIASLNGFAPSCEGWTVKKDTYEGIRVSVDENNGNGWFLLRLSVHDPVMPLNIESNESGGTLKICEKLYEFLKDQSGIDSTPLKKAIESLKK